MSSQETNVANYMDDDDLLPAMPFPPPSNTLLEQAGTDTSSNELCSWMRALPNRIRHCLSLWKLEWTGESLKQGYVGYVLPCRCQEPRNVDPNSPECQDVIDHIRQSGRFPEVLIREIEGLRDASRRFFTQSEFAGGPPKEEAIQIVFRSVAAGRDLLSALREPS
jgi:hypothetical protein